MRPRRTWLLAAGVGAALTAGGGAYAVASAEGPAGSTSPRSISVQGTATVPLAVHDSAGAATAVYREAMGKAIADGQAKAAYLAEKSGTALGVGTTTIEAGGYIECAGTVDEYAEYEGEQPDFGYGVQPPPGAARATPEATSAPLQQSAASSPGRVGHRPKRKPKHTAKTAARNAAQSCNLTADVDLVYAAG